MTENDVEIVKVSPLGKAPVRYPAQVIPSPGNWVAARAQWGHGAMDLGYLSFMSGDYLDEYFSLDRPYNAMALFREDHSFVGWYCNVTLPTVVEDGEIHWHDLFIDVIVYPDGTTLVLDEDELEESGLHEKNPGLHTLILAARDELLRLVEERAYPFSEVR
jgi:hypothetical protein